jgi:hypothetical protein
MRRIDARRHDRRRWAGRAGRTGRTGRSRRTGRTRRTRGRSSLALRRTGRPGLGLGCGWFRRSHGPGFRFGRREGFFRRRLGFRGRFRLGLPAWVPWAGGFRRWRLRLRCVVRVPVGSGARFGRTRHGRRRHRRQRLRRRQRLARHQHSLNRGRHDLRRGMPETHRHPEQQPDVRRDNDDERSDTFQIEGGHAGL